MNLYTNTVTISCRIKRNGSQVTGAGLVFSRDADTVGGLDFRSSNQLGYHWNNDPNTYQWNSGLVPLDGTWTFCALVVGVIGYGLGVGAASFWHSDEEYRGGIPSPVASPGAQRGRNVADLRRLGAAQHLESRPA